MPKSDDESVVAVTKSALSVWKRNHTRLANRLVKSFAQDVDHDDMIFLKQEFSRSCHLLTILEDGHMQYLEENELEDDGQVDNNVELQDKVRELFCKAENKLAKESSDASKNINSVTANDLSKSNDSDSKISEGTQQNGQNQSTSISNGHAVTQQNQVQANSSRNSTSTPKLRIPDMQPFDNTVRKFPRFKHQFRTHYEPHYGAHAAVVLKENLLTGFAKEICESAESVDDIFHELESEFGDAGRIIEAITDDIKKIRVCREGNVDDLMNLRQTLKVAEVDLKFVNLDCHIDHYQTVISVVSKLSPNCRRQWAEKVAKEKISVENRFAELCEYIALEIRTLELLRSSEPTAQVSNTGADNVVSSVKYSSNNSTKRNDTPQNKGQGPSKSNRNQGQGQLSKPTTNNNDSTKGEIKCLLHPNTRSHFFSYCKNLKFMSTDELVQLFENEAKDFCRSCLRPGHRGNCQEKFPKCFKENCSLKHFTFMHDACERLRSKDRNHGHSYRTENQTPTLSSISPAQYIDVQTNNDCRQLSLLWDHGSNLTLTTQKVCESAGFEILKEEPTNLSIETVGSGKIQQKASRCKIPLLNSDKELVDTIIAYVVETIGCLEKVVLTAACNIFGVENLIYPGGEINILLGTDNAQLALRPVSAVNGLRLDESEFGYVIYGSHPSFQSVANSNMTNATAFKGTIKTKISTPASRTPKNMTIMDDNVKSFFTTEAMGISCTPKCGKCGCGKCTIDGSGWTLQEKFEYDQIKSSIQLKDGVLTAAYPYRKNLDNLPNNREYAFRRMIQLEKDLQKNQHLIEPFNEQFTDMITRGKMRLLTEDEAKEWTGKVHYLPMNYVIKETSVSTPLRIIFDPASPFQGHSLNQYWGRGPNLVNDALGILFRFSEGLVSLFADIKKMYQTVMTTPTEWHLHRILWRYIQDRPPETYIVIANSFGDVCAGTVAIAALRFLAESAQEEFVRASSTIIDSSYVDDILDSCNSMDEAKNLARDVDTILNRGGFEVKKWNFVDSTSPPPEQNYTTIPIGGDNESVLGMIYNISTDEFLFRIHLNFSKKKRGSKIGSDLAVDEIYDKEKVPVLTKRNILSQVHTIYDPMGKIQPFVVEIKFALGQLYRFKDEDGRQLGWDDPINEEFDQKWRHLLNTFFNIRQLKFQRSLSAPESIDLPILVVFSDSSMIAYGTCMYIWRKLSNGDFFTRLIAAKSRMWPIEPDDYLSVCRGELQGALMAKKLAQEFLKFTRFSFQEIVFIIDSEIVLAQLNMDSHSFSVFVGHRVAEIRSAFPPDHWWFARSENNPCADLLSRGTLNVDELDKGTCWQDGPTWMKSDRSKWPISQKIETKEPIPELRVYDIRKRVMSIQAASNDQIQQSKQVTLVQELGESQNKGQDIKDEILSHLLNFTKEQENYIATLIDLKRRDDLQFWLAVTYRVLNAMSWKSGDGCFFKHVTDNHVVNAQQRHVAEIFWIKQAQRTIEARIKKGQFKTLTPFKDSEGIYRCNRRTAGKPGSYCPILLPHDHPFSRLIAIFYHQRGHTGATGTAAKVRAYYHILKLRHLTLAIRNQCQVCRIIEKKLMKTPMGPLPAKRFTPSYAFEHTSCDIFGPIPVELFGKETRKRKHDQSFYKAYGLILTCLSTRSIHIEAMHGQSTDSFLSAFRRFISIRGQPRSMYSDNGGQLLAADEDLQSLVDDFEDDKIKQFAASNAMEWTYTAPGSPWQNGISEALIRSVKKSIKFVLHNKSVSILDLQTIFYEIAQILNERPINLGHQGASGNDFHAEKTFLCPNELLLGRCSVVTPQGNDSESISNANRLAYNQELVTEFWKHWTELYLPTLITQSKWYKLTRPAMVGDVVFVRDINPIRGQWNIAEIVEIRDPEHPINVKVRYRTNSRCTVDKYQWRDVKNLALIVGADER